MLDTLPFDFDETPVRDTRRPMVIDSFAGGGGASTGIEAALGRSPDVAINHSPAALALHAANHPDTLHIDSNVWHVDPVDVCGGRRVGLAWFSPDCKHHSRAKGGKPVQRNIRDLAWIVVLWAKRVRPDVLMIENVAEFGDWGPLTIDNRPCPERKGQTFKHWSKELKRLGYKIEFREMRACDYGDPTSRKRLFIVARCDGRPIVWPEPTHGAPDSDAVLSGKRFPWRTAAEVVDWSLPIPSIFASQEEIAEEYGLRVKRPLVANTLARIARGMQRYVLDAERPFVVDLAAGEGGRPAAPFVTRFNGGATGHRADAPMATVTANSYIRRPGGATPLGVIAPGLVHIGNGERPGQAPRALDPQAPLGTVVAGGMRQYPFAAFLAQQNNDRAGVNPGRPADAPVSTITGTGSHQTPSVAWMAKWYGTDQDPRLDEPCHTVTTKARFDVEEARLAALPFEPAHYPRARAVAEFLRDHGVWTGGEFVTLTLAGETYVVVDIGLRMLTPRELYRAQGFPDDYIIDGARNADGVWRDFPKAVQISCAGNSVCPGLSRALVEANCQHLVEEQEVAA